MRIILFISFFLPLFSYAQQSSFLWAKSLGGPTAFNSVARCIVSDSLGNIYLSGYFYNTVDFDPGPATANLTANNLAGFVAKYDSSGNYQWAFKIGLYAFTILLDDSLNIIVSGNFYDKSDFDPGPDTAYLTSRTYYDDFIAKYSFEGKYKWAKRLAGGYSINLNYYNNISLDNSNNIFIGSKFEDTAYFTDNYYLLAKGWVNAFFAKYDSDGNFLWAKNIAGSDSSVSNITSISTDKENSVYITGMIKPNINHDFNPGQDTFFLTTTGAYKDGFLAKYDNEGNLIWAFALDGASQLFSYSLTTDKKKNIFIAGSIVGDADFDPGPNVANLYPMGYYYTPFFSKYDSDGNFIFAEKITSYGTDEAYNIKVDTSGRIFITGYFTDSTADFDPSPAIANMLFSNSYEGFWAVYDSSGNYQMGQSMYGKGTNISYDIFISGDDLIVSGKFDDSICFDNENTICLVSTGIVSNTDNVFFAKYNLDFTTDVNLLNRPLDNISVYPNPSNNQFTFNLPSAKSVIRIYNLFGTMIYLINSNHPSAKVNFSSQPSGIYFYYITTGEKTFSGKLIKE